jgi:hypothetical protein
MSQTPEEIEAEIEVQREQLAGTLDALSAKLDVKSQASAKVADAKVTAQAKVADARNRATTDDGRPRPELLVFGATVVVVAIAIVWWRHR